MLVRELIYETPTNADSGGDISNTAVQQNIVGPILLHFERLQMNDKQVELYPHDPQTILPLIRSFLPYSLTIVGAIQRGPIPSPPVTSDPHKEPWLWAWTTFSTSSLGLLELQTKPVREDFVVILQLPRTMKTETRLFCSAEANLSKISPPGRAAAQQLVNATVRRFSKMSEGVEVFGAVHEAWTDGINSMLSTPMAEGVADVWSVPNDLRREGESRVRDLEVLATTLRNYGIGSLGKWISQAGPRYTIWLAPEQKLGQESSIPEDLGDYLLDTGTRMDCQTVSPHATLYSLNTK